MRINPYLNFAGACAEAMTFYQTVFGGELSDGMAKQTSSKASQSAETRTS